jgi:hypothetical protein
MVTPLLNTLSPAFLEQEGRNTTASLQYNKGDKKEIQQRLSSYDTVIPSPNLLSPASLGQERRNTTASLQISPSLPSYFKL